MTTSQTAKKCTFCSNRKINPLENAISLQKEEQEHQYHNQIKP